MTRKRQGLRHSGTKTALRRPAPHRAPRPFVLIVCEGAKTEPQYFDGFRKAKRLSRGLIEIVPGSESGTNPKSIVEHAKARRAEATKRENIEFDEVWCVFDRDEHEWFAEAMEQARANHMRVALSNPSFELWLLLHFEYCSKPLKRSSALSMR